MSPYREAVARAILACSQKRCERNGSDVMLAMNEWWLEDADAAIEAYEKAKSNAEILTRNKPSVEMKEEQAKINRSKVK